MKERVCIEVIDAFVVSGPVRQSMANISCWFASTDWSHGHIHNLGRRLESRSPPVWKGNGMVLANCVIVIHHLFAWSLCCVHPGHCNQQFCYYKGTCTSFYLLSCLIGSLILHKLQCLPPLENFLYLHHCVIWVSILKKCSRGRNCASRSFANILS
jgi:hypothetical protein